MMLRQEFVSSKKLMMNTITKLRTESGSLT